MAFSDGPAPTRSGNRPTEKSSGLSSRATGLSLKRSAALEGTHFISTERLFYPRQTHIRPNMGRVTSGTARIGLMEQTLRVSVRTETSPQFHCLKTLDINTRPVGRVTMRQSDYFAGA